MVTECTTRGKKGLDKPRGEAHSPVMDTSKRAIDRERRLMTTFATRHHAEHIGYRNEFCKVCQHEALIEWAKREGII
jgi:hypothetical protein